MARKPAIVELIGGKGPRQRAWDAIRAQGDAKWTRQMIIDGADTGGSLAGALDAKTLETYLQALLKAGIVREAGRVLSPSRRQERQYVLARDEGVEAPRLRRDGSRVEQGLAQEQMWRTLRMVRGDTNARELAAHASTPAVPVAEASARAYLRMLATAGYLDCTAEGHGIGRGGIQSRYRLKVDRNTGPKPPMVCRTHVIFDPNLCAVVWAPEVTEEDADHVR